MKINPNIVCEQVGDEIIVMDSGSSAVVSITGHNATVVERVLAGEMVGEDETGVSELRAQGILIAETSGGLSRRSLMMGGVAIGAGGILALSLPSAAMASSSFALATPIFSNSDGENFLSDRANGDGGGTTKLRVDSLAIDFAKFLNRTAYETGAILEWSFSSDGEFRQFSEDTSLSRYVWEVSFANIVEVPLDNQLAGPDENKFTVLLRVKSGELSSAAVEVVFFWDDE